MIGSGEGLQYRMQTVDLNVSANPPRSFDCCSATAAFWFFPSAVEPKHCRTYTYDQPVEAAYISPVCRKSEGQASRRPTANVSRMKQRMKAVGEEEGGKDDVHE